MNILGMKVEKSKTKRKVWENIKIQKKAIKTEKKCYGREKRCIFANIKTGNNQKKSFYHEEILFIKSICQHGADGLECPGSQNQRSS